MKEYAAYTRMVGNEINKPLAQIPIVGEMYRAVTFPFLRWNGVKSSRRRAGRGPWGPPTPRHPPLFFSLALQTQSTFKTGRQQRATWEQPLSCRLSGSQSNSDSLTWKRGDRPWNVLPPVTQTDNVMWKELKANKKWYPALYVRCFPECDVCKCVHVSASLLLFTGLKRHLADLSRTMKRHVEVACVKYFKAAKHFYNWCNRHPDIVNSISKNLAL